MNFHQLADKSIAGETLTRQECQDVLHCPDERILELLDAAYKVRRTFCGNRVHLHMLLNAKSGLCPEDCHYCSQSRISTADIERYPMVSMDRMIEGARQAKAARSRRYCIAISARGANDREVDYLVEAVTRIKEEVDINICCTVGLISEEKAQRLYDAGVDPHHADRLGKLALSDAGLYRRDQLVLQTCLAQGYPVATVVGGGYAADVTVLAYRHILLFRAALEAFKELS